MNTACIFPGQGSQTVGMIADLFEKYPVVHETFDAASQIVGVNLSRLALEGPAEELNRTINTQPVVLTASVAMWRVWRSVCAAPMPKVACGHSLGEYSALVCAEAIDFEDALRLVRRRAELMQEAVADMDTGMAAVLGVDAETLARICETLKRDAGADAGADATLEAVNYNSPEQTVVAGHTRLLQQLGERLAAEFADNRRVKCVALPVSVPSHSSLMRAAAQSLRETLSTIDIRSPAIAVLHNVDAQTRKTPDEIREALALQLHSPVQWVNTQKRLNELDIDACLEMGPGAVLAGLMRRVNKGMPCYGMNTASDISAGCDALS